MGDLAVGNGGKATSSWVRYPDGDPNENGYVMVSSYAHDRPSLGTHRLPHSGRVGERLNLKVTPRSWLPASVGWRFGRGQQAKGRHVHHTYRTLGRHHVTITIKDASGAKTTITRTIRITRRH